MVRIPRYCHRPFSGGLAAVLALGGLACDEVAGPETGGPDSTWVVQRVRIDGLVGVASLLSFVQDAAGSLHVAYTLYQGDAQGFPAGLRYARCSGDCADPGAWARVDVVTGEYAAWNPSIAVGPAGVHILYKDSVGLAYASCPGSCTNAGSWTTVRVDTLRLSGWSATVAVDGAGALHAVHVLESDIRAGGCATTCQVRDNWRFTPLPAATPPWKPWTSDRGLVVDPSGRRHLVYMGPPEGDEASLVYATCAGDCLTAGDWTAVPLQRYGPWDQVFWVVGAPVVRLGDDARPRLLSWAAGRLVYGECAGDCRSVGAWSLTELTVDDGIPSGGIGFGLLPGGGALATTGYPSVLLHVCDGQCLEPASWRSVPVDTTSQAELDAGSYKNAAKVVRLDANRVGVVYHARYPGGGGLWYAEVTRPPPSASTTSRPARAAAHIPG